MAKTEALWLGQRPTLPKAFALLLSKLIWAKASVFYNVSELSLLSGAV